MYSVKYDEEDLVWFVEPFDVANAGVYDAPLSFRQACSMIIKKNLQETIEYCKELAEEYGEELNLDEVSL